MTIKLDVSIGGEYVSSHVQPAEMFIAQPIMDCCCSASMLCVGVPWWILAGSKARLFSMGSEREHKH